MPKRNRRGPQNVRDVETDLGFWRSAEAMVRGAVRRDARQGNPSLQASPASRHSGVTHGSPESSTKSSCALHRGDHELPSLLLCLWAVRTTAGDETPLSPIQPRFVLHKPDLMGRGASESVRLQSTIRRCAGSTHVRNLGYRRKAARGTT